MYNPNRLEWHLDDELSVNPAGFCVVLSYSMASLLTQFNRLAVALAKSQDHRASCGVFSFGELDCLERVKAQTDATNTPYSIVEGSVERFAHPSSCSCNERDAPHDKAGDQYQPPSPNNLTDRQGALADGLHGLNPRNTDTKTHPLACRPALIERLVKNWVQRWNKAQFISESIRHAHLVFFCFLSCFKLFGDKHEDGERWYIHPWRTYA